MSGTNDRFSGYSSSNSEHGSKETLAGITGAAGEKLADAAGQAQQVAQQQMDKLTEAIRNKPIQAAGIAAGVGFVLAMLARRH